MTVSGEYEKVLEDTLKEDLEWLEREFELLFRYKLTALNQIIMKKSLIY